MEKAISMLMVMDISATVPGGDDCDDTDPTRWEECGMFIIETVDAECITCPESDPLMLIYRTTTYRI